ncbi:hypothetical protein H4R99_008268, partial [Coemansia sp. RSA 1722]
MKFAALLAVASVAAAQNSNLAAIMAAMPEDLVAAMSYFPSEFISSLMVGSGSLPTDVNSLLAMAPGIPTEDIPKLSSEYMEFVKEVGPLLGTPTDAAASSSAEASSSADEGSASPEPTSDPASASGSGS